MADVTRTGALTYQIPIWAPPGPLGIQPNLALGYTSATDEDERLIGTSNPDVVPVGPGWALSGLPMIQRCSKTAAQDAGTASAPTFAVSDAYCLNGQRLRLTSAPATYGLDGSTYQTEIADFSLITAYGTTGYGPTHFIVKTKGGLTYEFGNSGDSRILLTGQGSSVKVRVWLLNKVSHAAGNYVIAYGVGQPGSNGIGMPLTISWGPTSSGSSTYQYTMSFVYAPRPAMERILLYASGQLLVNGNLLSAITIRSSGNVTRHYQLTYDTSPTTQRSRLQTVRECSDETMTDCLSPTTMTYVQGAVGVSGTAGTALSSSTSVAGAFDFNGDGKSDLLYNSGGTLYVAFSNGAGFGAGTNTGLVVGTADRYYPANLIGNGRDEILITRSGVWWRYYWTGSAFTGVSTGTPAPSFSGSGPSFMELMDHDGDGLSDLVMMTSTQTGSGNYYSGTIRIRRNTSVGGALSFSSTEATYAMPGCTMTVGCVPFVIAAPRWSAPRDLNGDRRADLLIGVTDIGINFQTTTYSALLSQGATYAPAAASGYLNAIGYLRWNDDQCMDVATSGTNATGTIAIAACDGAVAQSVSFSGTLVGVTDWNGDGRSDVLVRNTSTLGVYTSTGDGISSLITTTIPIASADKVVPLEVDGDGLPDVAIVAGASPFGVTYRLHNNVASLPDHLSSVTDGYGVTLSATYGTISAGNYTKGTGAVDPEEDWVGPFWVVKTLTSSDGIGGNYSQTFWYTGARKSRLRGFEGFQMLQVTDSRTNQIRRTQYDLLFPRTGMVKKDELYKADGTTLIASTDITNTELTLETAAGNQRYFPYASNITTNTYDIASASPITLQTVALDPPDVYGNFGKITETLTDKDTGSPFLNESWTTVTTTTYLPNPGTWCVGQPTGASVARTATGQGTITRTLSFGVDYPNCRRTSAVIEPGNTSYELTQSFDFDAFDNIKSETVSGVGVVSRTTFIDWGATGQFPSIIRDPVGDAAGYRIVRTYDFAQGTLESQVVRSSDGTTDNTPPTSWDYDKFGRLTKQTYPDGTATSLEYSDCAPSCFNGNHRLTLTQRELDSNGAVLSDQITYLDRFERPLLIRQKLLDGSYNQIEQRYDNRGRVTRQTRPCSAVSCIEYWLTYEYDALSRPTSIARPIKETISTTQSTTIEYPGHRVVVTDAQDKLTTKILDAAGNLRRSQDHTGYYQSFAYDPFGSLTGVTDSDGRSLFSATYDYGLNAFQRTHDDRNMGSGTATYNALGELREHTDANGRRFKITYDPLSRPLTRRDAVTSDDSSQETQTTWNWGQTPAAHNVGQLVSVSTASSDGTYSEVYSYDTVGRPSNHAITIPGDASSPYNYDFGYNAITGRLETLTYPTSTSYRFKVRYCYATGYLLKITSDSDCSGSSAFWRANEMNPLVQIKSETLGNGITTQRTFDAVTGWIAQVKSGTGANPQSVQNEGYQFDLVGNVIQRQHNTLGLNENFYYDDLYRLDYSTLSDGSGTTTNLDLSYADSLGNLHSKLETGNTDAPVGPSIDWTSYNYPKLITATVPGVGTQTASFAYGPHRQRWRMVYNNGTTSETTHYIGGLMEKVTSGSTTDYRHYIYAGGGLVAVYSRKSSGTNTLRYALEDHQGSIASLLNDSGAPIVNESFTAYGNRRSASTWSGPPNSTDLSTMEGITRQGYTGHIALGTMGLTHMNGRVQDAVSGTFLSPDPFVTEPGNTQNFNRYAYVHNNPLTFIDPSGFQTTGNSIDCVYLPENFSVLNYGGVRTADNTQIVREGAAPSSPCLWIPAVERRSSSGPYGACTTYGGCTPTGDQPFGTAEWVILGAAATGPLILAGGVEVGLWWLANPVLANELAIGGGVIAGGDAMNGGPLTVTVQRVVVLGKSIGLEARAAQIGGGHLMAAKDWQHAVLEAIGDPGTRIAVDVAHLPGTGSVYDRVMAAILRGASGRGSPFDWELSKLYEARRWSTVDFYEDANAIANPFR
jgi:RHS repeat-associated protein